MSHILFEKKEHSVVSINLMSHCHSTVCTPSLHSGLSVEVVWTETLTLFRTRLHLLISTNLKRAELCDCTTWRGLCSFGLPFALCDLCCSEDEGWGINMLTYGGRSTIFRFSKPANTGKRVAEGQTHGDGITRRRSQTCVCMQRTGKLCLFVLPQQYLTVSLFCSVCFSCADVCVALCVFASTPCRLHMITQSRRKWNVTWGMNKNAASKLGNSLINQDQFWMLMRLPSPILCSTSSTSVWCCRTSGVSCGLAKLSHTSFFSNHKGLC